MSSVGNILREDLDVQQLGWYVAPDFCVHEELPEVLVGVLCDVAQPRVRGGELLEHLWEMVIESSLSPVALISKVELKAAIFEEYLHALPSLHQA